MRRCGLERRLRQLALSRTSYFVKFHENSGHFLQIVSGGPVPKIALLFLQNLAEPKSGLRSFERRQKSSMTHHTRARRQFQRLAGRRSRLQGADQMMTSTVNSQTSHDSASIPPSELLAHSVDQVLGHVERRSTAPQDDFVNAAKALNALPLPTADFGQAINNLRNVRAYMQTREWGAAEYELTSFQR